MCVLIILVVRKAAGVEILSHMSQRRQVFGLVWCAMERSSNIKLHVLFLAKSKYAFDGGEVNKRN